MDPLLLVLIPLLIVSPFIPGVIRLILKEIKKIGRAMRIRSKSAEWGKENCQRLVKGRVKVGMTPEMLRAAFGKPSQDLGERWEYTWIYDEGLTVPGLPRGVGPQDIPIWPERIVRQCRPDALSVLRP